MALTILVYSVCQHCHGTGIYQYPGIGGGSEPCPWPGCNGTGKYIIGHTDLDPVVNEIRDMVDGLKPGVDFIDSYKLFDATLNNDFLALSDNQKDAYRQILSCGKINWTPGSRTRNILWSIFDGTETLTNLEAI